MNDIIPFPPPLKPGGTIGIVAPSGIPNLAHIEKAKSIFESRGYAVKVHPQCKFEEGLFAGSDDARAEAVMDMFADPEIGAIVCARGGGTGSYFLLDQLDYKTIAANPKPFIGFSEITVMLHAIASNAGFVTYHGPMCVWLAREDKRTIDDFFAVIEGQKHEFKFAASEVNCMREGQVEGRLVGGNITMMQNLIGTPYDLSWKDAILFVEDTDEVYYKIARMLTHYKYSEKSQAVRAILLGEMVDNHDGESGVLRDGERKWGLPLEKIMTDRLPSVPLCTNFPCGHGKYLTTLPIGAHARLNITKKGTELSFNPA
jgi:muramoyltetrapeptide carboxypeptidase